jgi:signal peptidase I
LVRLPQIPNWFYLGAVAIGAAVAIVFLLTGEKIVVEVPGTDGAMRPAIGKDTSFTVDPSWLAKRKRNAIVAYVPPGKSKKPSIARVVALEGDSLEVRARKLYVNGAVNLKVQRSMPAEEAPKFTCPRDCVYVLVDRPKRGTRDSCSFGPVPLWRVLGSITP